MNSGRRNQASRVAGRLAQHPLQVLDQSLTATISIGVASADGCSSLEELLARADAALYRAKKEGRNRIVLHESVKQAACRAWLDSVSK